MSMAQICQIRYECFCRLQVAGSAICRLRSVVTKYPAFPARQGASQSPVRPDSIRSATALGFLLTCGMGCHPRSIHRVTCCSGFHLCLFPISTQAPLWAYPSPGGTAPLCFGFPPRRVKCGPAGDPGCATFQVWVSRENSPVQHTHGCGLKCRRDFSPDPPQKARLGLGSRALREAPPSVP
jgi:hypothetical protein